jgi:hypothetical protein
MLPEQWWRPRGKVGGQPRARELAAATGALCGLEDHMGVRVGRRADRLVRNIHASHGGNAAANGFTRVALVWR